MTDCRLKQVFNCLLLAVSIIDVQNCAIRLKFLKSCEFYLHLFLLYNFETIPTLPPPGQCTAHSLRMRKCRAHAHNRRFGPVAAVTLLLFVFFFFFILSFIWLSNYLIETSSSEANPVQVIAIIIRLWSSAGLEEIAPFLPVSSPACITHNVYFRFYLHRKSGHTVSDFHFYCALYDKINTALWLLSSVAAFCNNNNIFIQISCLHRDYVPSSVYDYRAFMYMLVILSRRMSCTYSKREKKTHSNILDYDRRRCWFYSYYNNVYGKISSCCYETRYTSLLYTHKCWLWFYTKQLSYPVRNIVNSHVIKVSYNLLPQRIRIMLLNSFDIV